MSSEYKLNNYTRKGWIIKKAQQAYDDVIKRNKELHGLGLAGVINPPEALEKAIYAALDAAVDVGYLKKGL